MNIRLINYPFPDVNHAVIDFRAYDVFNRFAILFTDAEQKALAASPVERVSLPQLQ